MKQHITDINLANGRKLSVTKPLHVTVSGKKYPKPRWEEGPRVQ